MQSSPPLRLELKRSRWPSWSRSGVALLLLQLFWVLPPMPASVAALAGLLLWRPDPGAPATIELHSAERSIRLDGERAPRILLQAQPFLGSLALRLAGRDLWLWPDMLEAADWALLRSWLKLNRPGESVRARSRIT